VDVVVIGGGIIGLAAAFMSGPDPDAPVCFHNSSIAVKTDGGRNIAQYSNPRWTAC
jgi:thioredoxin reductase